MELNRYTVKYLMSFKFIKQNLIQIKCHSRAKSSAELTDDVLTMIYGSRPARSDKSAKIRSKKSKFSYTTMLPVEELGTVSTCREIKDNSILGNEYIILLAPSYGKQIIPRSQRKDISITHFILNIFNY